MARRLVVFVVVVVVATLVAAADVETVSRVFKLQHISLTEASTAVQPMLSEVGSLTLQPGLSRLTVQDVPSVITRVAKIINEIDRVPGTFRIQVELLEGGDREPFGAPYQIQPNDRLRRMFNAEEYRRLGSSMIEGVLGSPAQAEIGTSFQVSFLAQLPEYSASSPWGAPDPGNRIHVRQLVLDRKVIASDGTLMTQELLRTNALLSHKQTVYIGAGNSEDSKDVLVLIVRVEEFEGR